MALKVLKVEKDTTLWSLLEDTGNDPQLYREAFLANAYWIASGITPEFAKQLDIPSGIEIVLPDNAEPFEPSGM